ncbi:hypothetical protein HDU99_000887, partial [Rhizoclosmatium hyalinum]
MSTDCQTLASALAYAAVPVNVETCCSDPYQLVNCDANGNIYQLNMACTDNFLWASKPFPSGISGLPYLQTIFMSGCAMTGTLPDIFASLPNLLVLEVDGNRLTGSLPASLGSIGLRWGQFQNNLFTGSVPTTFTQYLNGLQCSVDRPCQYWFEGNTGLTGVPSGTPANSVWIYSDAAPPATPVGAQPIGVSAAAPVATNNADVQTGSAATSAATSTAATAATTAVAATAIVAATSKTTATTTATASSDSGFSLTGTTLYAVIGGGAALLLIIIGIATWCLCFRKRKNAAANRAVKDGRYDTYTDNYNGAGRYDSYNDGYKNGGGKYDSQYDDQGRPYSEYDDRGRPYSEYDDQGRPYSEYDDGHGNGGNRGYSEYDQGGYDDRRGNNAG